MTDMAATSLSYAFAKAHGLVRLPDDDTGGMRLGMRGRAAPTALLEARRVLGRAFRVEPLDDTAFDRWLSDLYGADTMARAALADEIGSEAPGLDGLIDDRPDVADLLDSEDDAPLIRLINSMIAEAAKRHASDIHIEPYESRLSIRFRIDGVLAEIMELPARLTPSFTSRLKVMARLDIAEKRIPQDGRISLTLGGRVIDVRVSTLPSRHGERVVLRLLDRSAARFDIEALGMEEETLTAFKAALAEPNGILLVTGPTGSGKTTTLYAGLSLLNDASRNILTVEDPVEYALEGIGQTQVNAKVGMTFAAGLRAILRQDPDVVMVGEIRDMETAEIAVQASLTGHLVLSTVHTNSAAGAITRLRDMGVEPFLLATSVKAILAQRLVRRLCDHCKAPYEADKAERAALGKSKKKDLTLYKACGCNACNNTGYQGRIGLYELITMDDTIQKLIHDDATEAEIAAHAFKGRDTLSEAGAKLVRKGMTTIEEVMRVVRAHGDA
ncbi:type II secretion system ATPase GspE [Pseudokordiimonas caeni]|uniref:type II secretion system ATPase GspE n=1 Tax=Pseudokordiimonas caeni TaxID=2997908 RepID=UPI00281101C1|nr:type II secretion system ATPase GspE [Pseudokordiimonas caeni]